MPAEHDDEFASGEEAAEANDPNVGAGTPETAPWEEVEVPWLRRQPIIALILTVQLPALAGFVTELAGDTDPATAILLGSVSTVLLGLGLVARRHVTPVARPRLDDQTPLTPPGA